MGRIIGYTGGYFTLDGKELSLLFQGKRIIHGSENISFEQSPVVSLTQWSRDIPARFELRENRLVIYFLCESYVSHVGNSVVMIIDGESFITRMKIAKASYQGKTLGPGTYHAKRHSGEDSKILTLILEPLAEGEPISFEVFFRNQLEMKFSPVLQAPVPVKPFLAELPADAKVYDEEAHHRARQEEYNSHCGCS